MPQFSAPISNFSLTSYWYGYLDWDDYIENYVNKYTTAKDVTAHKLVDLAEIANGSVIKAALLTVTLNSPSTGAKVKKVSGINLPSTNSTGTVDVTALVQAMAGVYNGDDLDLAFQFQAYGNSGSCSTSPGTYHSGVLNITNITLSVDYTLPFSACAAPSTASLDAAVSEGNVNVAYSGAAGGTNNAMTGLEVQYAESDDNYSWGGWAPYTTVATGSWAGSFAVAPSSTRARYRRFQLRTLGAAGADWYSGWVTVPGSVRRNSAPAAPGVTAPVASKIIYNSQPRILATVGSDTDGHSQTLAASGYAASSPGAQAPGKKLVLRRSSTASAGVLSVSVSSTDALGVASSAVDRSFTYTVPAWTDPALVAGETPIKAAHITELQAAINNVRAYYGLAAYDFSAITAGVTGLACWTVHVTQLRAAIDEVVSLVNGWDTANGTHDISLPAWIPIAVNCPAAAVIAQLRAAIPLL